MVVGNNHRQIIQDKPLLNRLGDEYFTLLILADDLYLSFS
jgi:hypothetical protein